MYVCVQTPLFYDAFSLFRRYCCKSPPTAVIKSDGAGIMLLFRTNFNMEFGVVKRGFQVSYYAGTNPVGHAHGRGKGRPNQPQRVTPKGGVRAAQTISCVSLRVRSWDLKVRPWIRPCVYRHVVFDFVVVMCTLSSQVTCLWSRVVVTFCLLL